MSSEKDQKAASRTIQLVTFSVGDEEYGVHIEDVEGVIRIPAITHLPQTEDFLKGVINLRGDIIPVIDMRERFKMEALEEKLPEDIGSLKHLKHFYLAYNKLSSIPDSLSQCSDIEQLTLHNNQIGIIPNGIANLRKLKKLILHDNKIAEIPEKIGNLSNLLELDLSNAKITCLPESIGKLTLLK